MHSTHGNYLNTKNWSHHFDPRIKLLLIILATIFIFIASSFWSLIILIIFMMVILITSKLPLKLFFTILKFSIFFMIFLTLIDGFIYKPDLLTTDAVNNLQLGNWISGGGGKFGGVDWYSWNLKVFAKSGFIALRISIILSMMLWLTSTTQTLQLTLGFESLLSPLKYIKIPVQKISLIMSLAIQSIPLLANEFHQVIKAQAARGIDVESKNPIKKIKAYAAVVIPMFVNALKQAEDLSHALEAKGYDPNSKRTHYNRHQINWITGTLSLLTLALIIVLLVFSISIIYSNNGINNANYFFNSSTSNFANTLWNVDIFVAR